MATWEPKLTKKETVRRLNKIKRALERAGCQFWACPGPNKPPEPMATCFRCQGIKDIRQLIKDL